VAPSGALGGTEQQIAIAGTLQRVELRILRLVFGLMRLGGAK
jgi:hypothetical protein